MSCAQQECQSINWFQSQEGSESLSFPIAYVGQQFSVKSNVHQDLQVHCRYLKLVLRLLQSMSGLLCIA